MQGSFLQTPFWAEFKSRHGWKYFRFKVSDTDKEEISVQNLAEAIQYRSRTMFIDNE